MRMSWEILRKDKTLGWLAKKKTLQLFFLKFPVLTSASLWKLSWDWSSRRCIFNTFSSLGPCSTPRPPFSPRYWFNMMSALHRNEGSASKAPELAESRSSRGELIRTPTSVFQEGCKYQLCIMAFLGLNTWKIPVPHGESKGATHQLFLESVQLLKQWWFKVCGAVVSKVCGFFSVQPVICGSILLSSGVNQSYKTAMR